MNRRKFLRSLAVASVMVVSGDVIPRWKPTLESFLYVSGVRYRALGGVERLTFTYGGKTEIVSNFRLYFEDREDASG